MKKIIAGLSLFGAVVATPALAATDVSTLVGSPSSFAAPAGATVVMNFNNPLGTIVEANSKGLGAVITGNARRVENTTQSDLTFNQLFLRPEPSDNTGFFGVGSDGSLTLTSSFALSSISLFAGSIDAYNVVKLLDATGSTIATYDGTQILGFTPPFPGTTSSDTNRRVTFTGTGGTTYYGINFSNKNNMSAFEFDNVALTAAVPEPGTWLTMILGFGVVGAALRRRKAATPQLV